MQSSNRFDAVIVGGGMVGSTMALMLGQLHYRVLLVEQFPTRETPPDSDVRTMALTQASQTLLTQLKVWEHLAARAVPIKSLCVTMQGQFGSAHMQAPSAAGDDFFALGAVVSVYEIGAALSQAISTLPNIIVLQPASVIGHEPQTDHWQVKVQSPSGEHTVQTRLLIAADGAGSALAKANHLHYDVTRYDHVAICANLALETRTPYTAHERFLRDGAIALLPWTSPYATCIWTHHGSAEHAMALSDVEYVAACQQAFGRRAGRFLSVGKRVQYPLSMQIVSYQTGWRFCVMGNAAHQLHPIAAQGLNLSISDIAQWRSLLMGADQMIDLGAADLLEQYQQLRRSPQAKVMKTTDMIAKLAAGHAMPAMMKGMGITLFDLLPPVKKAFTRWGMGWVA